MKDIILAKDPKPFIAMAKKLGIEIEVAGKRIVKSSERDRNLIEKKQVDGIYDFELNEFKDKTHYRESGINQVIAKLMSTNKVEYIINFQTLLKANPLRRANIFGRIMQNLRICKKYKVKVGIYSFASNPMELRNPKDMEALLKVLS